VLCSYGGRGGFFLGGKQSHGVKLTKFRKTGDTTRSGGKRDCESWKVVEQNKRRTGT